MYVDSLEDDEALALAVLTHARSNTCAYRMRL